MASSALHRLIELATVHPIDRFARQIEMQGQPEPANTELGRPNRLGLPKLSELGADLLQASLFARVVVVLRPFALIVLYALIFEAGWWPVAMLLIPYIYLTAGAALHDLMHRALGIPNMVNHALLFAVGALVLESGHTLRETHQVHHRKLHTRVDPEGYVDEYTPMRALGEGLFYKHYLACWVMRNRPKSRPWVLAEGLLVQVVILLALVIGWRVPAFGVYVGSTVLGSWLFPYVGVKLVHAEPDDGNVLTGTVTLRGAFVSWIGCGLTFHLEHHLYPRVPGHKLRTLSKRLDTRLGELGVEPLQVV